MRKQVFGRHFSRSRKAREALFKSLIKAFILHGKIDTTYAKAKAISGDIDGLVILAKEGTVASRRRILAYLSADRTIVEKFVNETSSAFSERQSGFTRIVRLPNRKGDSAQMARIEWSNEVKDLSKAVKVKKQTPKISAKKKVVKKAKKVTIKKVKKVAKKK